MAPIVSTEASEAAHRIGPRRAEYTRTIASDCAIAIEALTLERLLSDLVKRAYGLNPAEIEPM